jgi:uncharacterized protein YbjT (DUF2867 family)
MILVIGGTGKIGGELVKQIGQSKIKARVLVRSGERAEAIQKLGLETAVGDVSQIETIKTALQGAESLFLLTAPSLHMSEIEIAIMDAAKKAGVKKIVLQSAMGVNLQSAQTVIHEHSKSQEYLKKLGLTFTILQPSSFFQNFLLLKSINKQGAIYGNYKEGKMGFVDAKDIASVALAALTQTGHEGKTYVITGNEALTYGEVASKVSRATGKTVKYINVSTDEAVKGMVDNGMPEWLSNDLGKSGERLAAGDMREITDVVQNVTHKKPVTLDQFLTDNVEAFK